ncbi:ABC transporter substrate-binding protein [Bifidobacterium sp. UBA6881]|mgnify:FL=1|uniref:ABC transporter substrate-binding protein n=1 Tax=Bifidobacterium sp. UBA6881 TaxID=1946109 RepID=UPI0025BC4313|nr:sugar ABC transporter substrate-binding protein [Bifidobacterium sp. UBA6881]
MIHRKEALALLCTASVLALGLSGCSGDTATNGTEITLWTWQSTIGDFVKAFEKQYPSIHVNVQNVGSNDKEYMQLSNAIDAGRGVPDLVYLDYNAVQQYAISGDLREIDSLGFRDISSDFTNSAISNVTVDGQHYALPISSGPMVMFYNKTIFDKAGITRPPETWDEYYADAQQLTRMNSTIHITNDACDGGFIASMLWQSGSRPFTLHNTTLGIDLSARSTQRFATMWQRLLDDKLIDTSTASWSDAWYSGLQQGKIATLLTGAWMTTTLKKNLPDSSGEWRIAPMPQYDSNESRNSENGGGALALPKKSADGNIKSAYLFAKWFAHDGGVKCNLDQDGIPPLNRVFADDRYLKATDSFFGGQETHLVIAQAAKEVDSDWQYLPFMAYANQIVKDTVGKVYQGKSTMRKQLSLWGVSLQEYARQQGFTLK